MSRAAHTNRSPSSVDRAARHLYAPNGVTRRQQGEAAAVFDAIVLIGAFAPSSNLGCSEGSARAATAPGRSMTARNTRTDSILVLTYDAVSETYSPGGC